MAKDLEKWCPETGQALGGRLVIQREVGRGLHGVSFLAQDNTDQSLVRVKVLSPQYFEQEHQKDNNLFLVRRSLAYRETAIVQINDVIPFEDTVALVSPWVSGKTLADELRAREAKSTSIAPMELLPIITDVVTGLRWIHRFGAHGNLRPENLLLAEDGTLLLDPYALQIDADVRHLEDFARQNEMRNHFVAPERRHETGRDDPRSDIYALAKILGCALTGSVVPSGKSLQEHGGGQITNELDELFVQATVEDPSKRISLDEFFRVVGAGLTEASERSVGFERSDNITLVTGLPAMTDELLEAVELEKKRREEKAGGAKGLDEPVREGFLKPSLCANEVVASEGTILHGAALPGDQISLVEEALEEVLKRRVSSGAVKTEPALAESDAIPEMTVESDGDDPGEQAVQTAQTSAQEDMVASVRDSMNEGASEDEFTVDLEEILDEMDSIESTVKVPEPEDLVPESSVDLDSTIEIGVDFDFEELPKDATPAPEEIEIEVIAEADLLLEDIGAEQEVSYEVDQPLEVEAVELGSSDIEIDAVELGASDLEVESITPEVAHEIANQVNVQTIGDISDAQKPYGGVDTDRITLPNSGKGGAAKDGQKSFTSVALIGSGLLIVLIVLFIKVINDSKDGEKIDPKPLDGSAEVVLVTPDSQEAGEAPAPVADVKVDGVATNGAAAADAGAEVKQVEATPDVTEAKVDAGSPSAPDVGVAKAQKDVVRPTDKGRPSTTPDTAVSQPAQGDAGAAPVPSSSPVTACPPSFVQIPGKEDVPSFCMQTHEYPGADMKPKVKVTLSEAKELCGELGARLCKKAEFPLACDGRYPYGKRFRRSRCNVAGEFFDEKRVKKSGSKKKCVSELGVFDLSGNVAEWVEEGLLAGGSSAESGGNVACTKFKKAKATRRLSKVGFRCCLSLQP